MAAGSFCNAVRLHRTYVGRIDGGRSNLGSIRGCLWARSFLADSSLWSACSDDRVRDLAGKSWRKCVDLSRQRLLFTVLNTAPSFERPLRSLEDTSHTARPDRSHWISSSLAIRLACPRAR